MGTTAYAGDFTLQASALTPAGADLFVGMNADPVTDDGYHSIDHALQLYTDGRAWLHENGSLVMSAPVNGKVWIWREGTVLKYGTGPDLATAAGSGLMRTVQNATGTLYFDSSFKSTASEAEVLVQSPASTGGGGSGGLTGPATFAYDSENRLVSASGAVNATLAYDPLGRLSSIASGGATTRFLHDGSAIIAEYDGGNVMQRRYVHGGEDEPVVQYAGAGTGDREYLHADERGSIVAFSGGSGTLTSINRYDEYGVPHSANSGLFQYTGQAWMPQIRVYYYKARMYDPLFARFLQTDPAGLLDGPNLYVAFGGDPVNVIDTTGLYSCPKQDCEAIERARQNMLRAARDLAISSRGGAAGAANAIRIGADMLGQPGQDNGIHIMNGRLDDDVLGEARGENGGYRITLDFAQIDRAGGIEIGAGVLAHEAVHVAQFVDGGHMRDNHDRYRRELGAYWLQSWVGLALGETTPSAPMPGTRGYARKMVSTARQSCARASVREWTHWRRQGGARPMDGMCQ